MRFAKRSSDTKELVRRHGSRASKSLAHRLEKRIETATRRQGKQQCRSQVIE